MTKKRRTTGGGVAATATIASKFTSKTRDKDGKPGRKQAVPFRRVDPDKITVQAAQDNRYEAKVRLAYPGLLCTLLNWCKGWSE